ncbi:phage major capsid protein [uncultured Intestinimonas sp.]|uniref:phage major capsid protein n=1 Tax=uncultured Intestinimonas sp. TaxID=1689265 RepID=UPI0025E37D07|nr:phage major capsid protein [uncultured Intestinimonas sp.]
MNNRLEEIEARLAAIPAELEQEGADLNALEAEVKQLKEERKAITEAAEKRRQILSEIGAGGGRTVRTFDKSEPQKRTFAPDSEEYRAAWLKNLQGKPLDAEERAAVTATAAIPTQTMDRIISTMDLTPMIAAVDVTYIPGNVSWPIEGTVNDAAWVEMAAAATDSADTLAAVSLGAYKLIKTLEITADVQAMAIPAFESWLVSRLANKLSVTLDKAIFSGTGTNQATGLLKSGEITNTGTYTAAGMTYADLLKIFAALPSKYHPNATLVTTRQVFFGQILGMVTDSGDKVVVADAQSPAKFNVLGYPAIVDDNCAADTVLFGDLKEAYKLNFAQSPTVESDRSVGFRSGSTVYRAMALVDGKPADKNAVTVWTKAGG